MNDARCMLRLLPVFSVKECHIVENRREPRAIMSSLYVNLLPAMLPSQGVIHTGPNAARAQLWLIKHPRKRRNLFLCLSLKDEHRFFSVLEHPDSREPIRQPCVSAVVRFLCRRPCNCVS